MKRMGSERIGVRALDSQVLVVAVRRVEGAWCAYIKNVPGDSHEAEAEIVQRHGSKLPADVARCLFPYIEGPYAW